MTYGYEKEKMNGKKIVNGNFEILDKLGEGSFWNVFKVERNVIDENINHKSLHVFKEGKLSFLSPEDEINWVNSFPDKNHEDNQYIVKNNKNQNDFKFVGVNNLNNINYPDIFDFDSVYSNENIEQGIN
jgi:hypothetical protein